ncbi:nucleotidyltransferase domain-containing protein [Deinococcus aluminii]
MPDLSFVQHGVHRRLLAEEVARALEAGALGLMLCGSVARGTARPTSDLDLRLYWPEARPFEAEEHGGILIERRGHTLTRGREQVEAGRAELYAWVEGRLLHDPSGELARLQREAEERLAAYRTPPEERHALRYWLSTVLYKLEGASQEQMAFLVHTNTWKLAEALCAVNDCPIPPATLLWETLPGLSWQPEGDWLCRLLLGEAEVRQATFGEVAAWLLCRL